MRQSGNPITRSLGSRLKSARLRVELTQSQVAKKAGITQAYLAHLETGRYDNPSVAVLLRVADALEVSAMALLGKV